MNRDLEGQLDEMGPEYRTVVDRLLAAYRSSDVRAEPSAGAKRGSVGRIAGWSVAYLVAASLLVFLGLAVVFHSPRTDAGADRSPSEYLLAHLKDDASARELLRTQNPDGSWKNDFLTRQNAKALAGRADEASRIAYKKAMRNLRQRGLL